MFICVRRHEISPLTVSIRCDLIFTLFAKRGFLRKSCDAPLCFSEPWFGFPTFQLGRKPRDAEG